MVLVKEVARLVAQYIRSNPVPATEVPALIRTTYEALVQATRESGPTPEKPSPAVPVRKSVMPLYVVCLECGKKLKILKRHIAREHGLTVEAYRAKWELPVSHPLVAPDYAERRSTLAHRMGLGRGRKKVTVEPAAAETALTAERHHYPTHRWAKPTDK